MSSANIRVYVRVRPLNAREQEGGSGASSSCLSVQAARRSIELHSKPESKLFTFDHVADADQAQEDVFEKVGKPITDSCLAGYNATIFAYGQTGSGKTYTIQGGSDGGNRGLMPRVFDYLMASIAREERKASSRVVYAVRASFVEIYNERIFDLLEPASSSSASGSLQLREDSKKGIYVEGLCEELVRTGADCVALMERGVQSRRVGETVLNRESSRSHCVMSLSITSTTTQPNGTTIEKNSRFNLIDLAGSERAKHTQATGARLDEAKNINRSLSALGNVIRELMKKSQNASADVHIPYRDSKLTLMLRESIGGNSLTYLIACVSSAGSSFFETMSTLKFATMASSVKNHAKVNESQSANVEALRAENEKLKESLQKMIAAQQIGARRISMIGMMPGVNPRESLCGGVGLVTPARLRVASSARSPLESSLLLPSTPLSSNQTVTSEEFKARESAWNVELETMKEQLELMERKERLDGMMRRTQERMIHSLRVKNISEIDPLVNEQLELATKTVAEVSHAPSLLKARYQIEALQDQIAAMQQQAGAALTTISFPSEFVPSHRREFQLQQQMQSEQERVTELETQLEAAIARLDEPSPAMLEKVAALEAESRSERQMAQHLETELLHATRQAKEAQEELLLKAGYLLRAENERDQLRRVLTEMEARHASELQAFAQSSQASEADVANRLLKEIDTWKERYETAHKESTDRAEELFQRSQEKILADKRGKELEENLEVTKNKLAALEASAKSAAESSAEEIQTLTSRVVALSSEVEFTQAEFTSKSNAHSSLQLDYSSLSAQHSSLQSIHEKLSFDYETLQEDHDTLTNEYQFQESEIERAKDAAQAASKSNAEQQQHVQNLDHKLMEKDELITKLKAELEEAHKAQSLEAAFQTVLSEKSSLEETVTELRNEIEVTNLRVIEITDELKHVEETKATLIGENAGLEQKVSDLTAAVQSYSSKHTVLVSTVSALESDLSQSSASLSELTEAHERLQEASQIQSENLLAQTEQICTLETQLEQLTATITALESDKKSGEASLKQSGFKIQELESTLLQKQSVESDLVEAKSSLAQNESRIVALQSEKDAVEAKLSEIVTMAASLGANAAAEESQKRSASQAFEQAQAENASLKQKYEKTESELMESRKSFAELQATLDALEGMRISRDAEWKQMREQLQQAKEESAPLRVEREALLVQVAELNKSLANLKLELSSRSNELELASKDSTIAMQLQTELQNLQERWTVAVSERETWLRELEDSRKEEARLMELHSQLSSQLESKSDALAAVEEKLAAATKANAALEETNSQLTGHQNQKQKIQLHMQIKKENESLRVEKANLEREIKKFRKLHHLSGGANAAANSAALEKELAAADDHIREGEQAQVQLKALIDRIQAVQTKVRSVTDGQSVLGDITNGAAAASASAASVTTTTESDVHSFPTCLTALSSFSLSFASLGSQLNTARRELVSLKNQQRLQQMKDNLAAEKQANRAQLERNGNFAQEIDQENM